MKNASTFIRDLRVSDNLCRALEDELGTVDKDDPNESLAVIVRVGANEGYVFTEAEYKQAALEFSREKATLSTAVVNERILMGPWTTGGASCVAMCPTRSDVC